MNDDTEIALADVTSALSKWYYSRVRSDAKDYARRVRSGEFASSDAFIEDFDSYTDGADIIIYTYQAQLVYVASDLSAQALDELRDMGIESPTDAQRALFCFRLDLMAQLEAELGASLGNYFR